MTVGRFRIVVAAALLASAQSALADGEQIVAALVRSQTVRLESFPSTAQDVREPIVRGSFERLSRRVGPARAVELRVVTGPVVAECLLGHVIVANAALADQTEPVRMFLLAHELGHVMLGHWEALQDVYARHLPGAVEARATDDVAARLAEEASRLSVQQELKADAFALDVMRSLGYSLDDVIGAFTAYGMQQDTATHPGTRKRVAHLRWLAAGGRDAVGS